MLYLLNPIFESIIIGAYFVEVKFLSEKKGQMTVAEAGRKGGLRTAETHGGQFYSEIGRKGGKIGGPKGGQRIYKITQGNKQ
jgi:general stress protein YciG